MRIDLHLHSSASDGTLAPAVLVGGAARGGLTVVALADHDTVAGVAEARAAAPPGLHVIPALEVSTTRAGAELHVLGYGIDPEHPQLVQYSRSAAARRAERMHDMIARLGELGISVTYEDVIAAAGADVSALGRPHLARALVARGQTHSIAEAFDRYLGDGGPAFLPTQLLPPDQAADLIHAAGGVAVWAHPAAESLEQELPGMLECGIDGAECFRPRVHPLDARRMADIVRDHGMLVTGGSDWHGEWHGQLGEFYVQREEVAEFLQRIGV